MLAQISAVALVTIAALADAVLNRLAKSFKLHALFVEFLFARHRAERHRREREAGEV